MMKIIDFLITNWSDVTLVVSVLFIIIYSSFTNRTDYLRAELFSLVTEAEKVYGGKTGQVKLMYVVKKVYSKMPVILKLFLSEKQLEKIIENVLVNAKKSWSEKEDILKEGENTGGKNLFT